MRGTQAARIIKMMMLLGSHRAGVTVQAFARDLEVGVRTIYRDLDVLRDAGFPLDQRRDGRSTHWTMVEHERFKIGTFLALSEVLALHVAAELLGHSGGAPWREAMAAALEKVDLALPAKLTARLEEGLERVSVSRRGERPYAERPQILAAVTEALSGSHPLHLTYRTPGRKRPSSRVLHPYLLHLHDRGLYLVGKDSRSQEVRTFLLDRILLASVGEGRFEPPDNFDADAYFRDAFAVFRGGEILHLRLRVAPAIAHLFEERKFHPSQRVHHKKGGLIVRMRVADTPELRAFVLSFGAQVQVEAPEHLADALAREAEACLLAHARQRGLRARSARDDAHPAAERGPEA